MQAEIEAQVQAQTEQRLAEALANLNINAEQSWVPNNITNRDETMNDASMISARQKKTYPRRNGKYMPGENDEN
jgi:hypothetical protein